LQGWRASHDTTRTIAELRVGRKALTNAPRQALEAAERDLPRPGAPRDERLNPATWKLVRLRGQLRWDDGTLDDINVETLQPPSWLAAHQVRVGGEAPIPMDLEELGLPEVPGRVLAVEPCAPIQPGRGRVILTTINHLSADVHELTIRDGRGQEETIRTTGGHKFYSVTRAAWVSAGELRRDEQLDGLQGPVHVVSVARLPGVHRVYNMTVEGDHVYHVSSLGVLTHNSWSCFGATSGTAPPNTSPALRNDAFGRPNPWHPDAVAARIRPPYRPNPAHDPTSPFFNPRKTPEPSDARDVYLTSIRADMGTWFGRASDGQVYRFFSDGAGGVHFSGIVPESLVPRIVLEQL
jgi:hypothetical protein